MDALTIISGSDPPLSRNSAKLRVLATFSGGGCREERLGVTEERRVARSSKAESVEEGVTRSPAWISRR